MNDLQHTRYTDSIQFRCLENLRKTSMDLSLIHCGKEQCSPMHLCQDTRKEYIIHFVLSGKGMYTADGKAWTLKTGEMFLIRPGAEISYVADVNDPWQYAWVGFNGLRAENILRDCGFSAKNLVLNAPENKKVLHYINLILEHRHLTLANDLRREACLIELLALLIDQNTMRCTAHPNAHHDYSSNIYVNHAIEYIRYSYQDGINVSDIADYIGISRTYLNASFQKELGISVQKFLIDFRLHKAASLLLSTTNPVNEIAMAVGYDDALAFSKAFKKKFDVSPKNYRAGKQSLDHYDKKQ